MADTSLSGARVVRELTEVIARLGRPCMIVSDNGTELFSRAIHGFCEETAIEWHYIARDCQDCVLEAMLMERGESSHGCRKSASGLASGWP